MAKVVEQEGPVLQLEEAKAHPKECMCLPLAFMDVNVKDLVGKVDSPEMVSSVPMVGNHAGRELGSRGAVLSCKESVQVSRELGLRDIHPALQALNLSLIAEKGLPSTGRLRFFLGNWRAVTNYREVLDMVQGLHIDWISQPFQLRMPRPPVFSSREQSLIANELDSLLEKGAVIPVDWCEGQFLIHIFLVPKKRRYFLSGVQPQRAQCVRQVQTFQNGEYLHADEPDSAGGLDVYDRPQRLLFQHAHISLWGTENTSGFCGRVSCTSSRFSRSGCRQRPGPSPPLVVAEPGGMQWSQYNNPDSGSRNNHQLVLPGLGC